MQGIQRPFGKDPPTVDPMGQADFFPGSQQKDAVGAGIIAAPQRKDRAFVERKALCQVLCRAGGRILLLGVMAFHHRLFPTGKGVFRQTQPAVQKVDAGGKVGAKKHRRRFSQRPKFFQLGGTLPRRSAAQGRFGAADKLADRFGHTLIAEQTSDGLHLYADESAVMTNEPPLPIQLHKLTDYAHLSAHPPRPAFGTDLQPPYSGGMGAIGLPGDWSSSSRFVRAAFAAANSPDGLTGNAAVTQLLHCLGAAAIPMGCVYKEDGRAMYTRYTSAANLVRGTYTRTTYTDLSPKTYTFALAEGEDAAVKVLA